jgi:hypothetical protein
MNKRLAIAVWLVAAGCGGAGLGAETRADITARMTSAQPPLEACYRTGLAGNRKLAGTMVLAFAAAPTTGQFQDITVARDDLGDPGIRRCVIDEVGKLKLAKPQATRLSISYPIHFAPEN